MRRILPIVLALVLLTAWPLLAQQPHVVSTPDTLKWMEPATFPGAKLALVHGDPGKEGLFVYRVQMPAHFKIPPHFHKASENVTVLSGSFNIGLGERFDASAGTLLPVGGFVAIPPMHRHYAWAGNEETLIQVHGVGPTDITFVNPADDPRKK